jgi:hypothetical protein
MARKLLIFGNGLGMALDPQHFSLTNALNEIWNREDFLTDGQKALIERCLERNGAPESEEELNTLHYVVTYCKELNKIGDDNNHWLTEDGQEFPTITAKYIHKVATYLHNYNGELPDEFSTALVDFVKETKSHVATLNYDRLIYDKFIENDVLDGFNGKLVDGMLRRGFSAEALERKYDHDFGYYLHLHGSPLFKNNGNSIVKIPRRLLTLNLDEATEHIVLTHVNHKPAVIAASHALSTYWDYLQFAISESEEIILFGYSGLDVHLNKLIKPYLQTKALKIVEWSGAGAAHLRRRFWIKKFGHNIDELIRLDNITTFTQW